MQTGSFHIGTSGWHYNHWNEVFYPKELASSAWLAFYAEHFTSVEINNTFYQFPSASAISHWLAAVPEHFVFALKASRFITHMKKLHDCEQPLTRFLERARSFERRLGPVLFQLPPHWRVNTERLEGFLKLLPSDIRFAMEFRDPSWHIPAVYDLLTDYGVAFCQFDLAGFQTEHQVTSDLIYVRLHGPGAAYCGSYSEKVLQAWAKKLLGWKEQGKQAYLFFDNDEAGYAVQDAMRLIRMCRDQGPKA